jgi:hypothetical protein
MMVKLPSGTLVDEAWLRRVGGGGFSYEDVKALQELSEVDLNYIGDEWDTIFSKREGEEGSPFN